MTARAFITAGCIGGGFAVAGFATGATAVGERWMPLALGGATAVGGLLGVAVSAWWKRMRVSLLDFASNVDAGHGARLPRRWFDDPEVVSAFNRMAMSIERRARINGMELAQRSAVLEAMIEGVVGLDRQGRIVLVNDAMQALLGVENPVGRLWVEIVRDHDVNELIRRVVQEGVRLGGEVTFDTFVPVKTFSVVASVASGGGEAEGELRAIVVFHDVTELKRLGRARTDFVANVAHELRTPLTSVSGYLEALFDGAKDDPEQREEFLHVMKRHTDRLTALVGDLLQLSQIESGVYRWRQDPVDLVALSRRSVALVAPVAAKKGVSLEIRSTESATILHADGEKLTEVLLNLMDNALKYTPEGGTVELEVGRENDEFVLRVSDTGVGIPSSDLQRIFERFYRVDRARSRDLGGTGLGLSIVKHIVEAHRGRIDVTSRVGEGSTFVVHLPQTEDPTSSSRYTPEHDAQFTSG